MAFGEMGLTPQTLEKYTHAQFAIKAMGFQKEKDRQETIFRRMTYLTMRPHLSEKSKFNIEEAWPILSDTDKKEYRTNVATGKQKVMAMLQAMNTETTQ